MKKLKFMEIKKGSDKVAFGGVQDFWKGSTPEQGFSTQTNSMQKSSSNMVNDKYKHD